MPLNTGTKIALGVAIAASVTTLVVLDPGEGVLEYMYVEKVAAAPADYAGRTIKVHGVVVEGSIRQKPNQPDYRFVVEHGGARLSVHYTNLVPDTFQEGGEVVLTGRLDPESNVFESDEMSAKCPSKYNAAETAVDQKAEPKS